ncbi:MAG TPA: glycosyltransferase, partial [Dehalococcoidia bacterium]|nr:glycosyltransferase [Dehalococcoidia bacterium]
DINGDRTQPNFKPDYSPDLLLAHNYITHLVAVRRQLCIDAGGLRPEYDGAQDYDLLLRLTDDKNRVVHHIPEVLYHWRQSASSTSLHPNVKPTAEKHAQLALMETLARRNIDGLVESAGRPHFFHVRRQLTNETLSIVIPFKDHPSLLRQCIESILSKTTHQEYEIIAISNNSDSPETFALMDELARRDSRLTFYECNVPFNFSALINFGVQKAQGTHITSINSDVELISWNWAEALMAHTQRPEVGVVGGKLYFPDNTIQHAGIVVGINGYAGHAHKGRHCNDDGYFHRANLIQNISAVTGAFMMFRKTLFEQMDGFDESYPVACNDIDFCLRVREHGFLNIFTPYAEAYHHESSTRGYEDSMSTRERFNREVGRFRTRHKQIIESGDPYYNVNLSLLSEDFEIRDTLRHTYDKTLSRQPT